MSDKPSEPQSAAPKGVSDKQRERVEKMEQKFQDGEKRKKEQLLREDIAARTNVVREGRMHIERKNYPGAMASYRRFLDITARMFDTELGGLQPSHFSEKSRVAEALVISSTCWDMLKILDKLQSPDNVAERKQIHGLFIRFTKGMPFQHFAAENLRKHLEISKTIVNKQEFWNTYRTIAGSGFCIVATWAFDSDSHESVKRLRRFRDEVLWPHSLGRAFVKQYYRRGYIIADGLAPIPGARKVVRAVLSGVTWALPGGQMHRKKC